MSEIIAAQSASEPLDGTAKTDVRVTGDHTQAVPPATRGAERVNDRLVWVDAAKGLSMVLVVLLHSSNWYADGRALGYSFCEDLSHALQPLRIPLFFIVSGLLVSTTMVAGRRKLVLRGVSLLSVYLAWTTIHACRLLVFPSLAPDTPFSPALLLWSAITPGIYWYIWGLPIYYFLTLPVFAWSRDRAKNPPVAYPALALAAIVSFLWKDISDAWTTSLSLGVRVEYNFTGAFVRNYFWFLVGVLFSRDLLSITRRVPTTGIWPLALGAGLITLGMLVARLGLHFQFSVSPFFLVPGVILILCRLSAFYPIRYLEWVGRQTLPVYIFHFFLLNLLSFLVGKTGLVGPFPGIVGVIVPLVMMICIVPITISAGRALRVAHLGILLDGIPDGLRKKR